MQYMIDVRVSIHIGITFKTVLANEFVISIGSLISELNNHIFAAWM